MTDKEQIMIDGCNVSECLFYQSNFEEDYDVKIKHFCSNWHNSCESANNSNCYFKQLTRKTQECEELDDYAKAQENLRKANYKEFLKKNKALEEIEEYCKEQNLKYDTTACMILDIICKVKDGER